MVENDCFDPNLSIYLKPIKEPKPICNDLYLKFEQQINENEVNPYDVYGHCWHDEFRRGNTSRGFTAQDYTPWMFPEHE